MSVGSGVGKDDDLLMLGTVEGECEAVGVNEVRSCCMDGAREGLGVGSGVGCSVGTFVETVVGLLVGWNVMGMSVG